MKTISQEIVEIEEGIRGEFVRLDIADARIGERRARLLELIQARHLDLDAIEALNDELEVLINDRDSLQSAIDGARATLAEWVQAEQDAFGRSKFQV